GELLDDAAAPVGVEVHLDRALAAVGRMEIGGAEVAARLRPDERRPPGARVVAGAVAFDLDHVGAEVGEQLPAPRSGKDAGEFHDPQTGERSWHFSPPGRCRNVMVTGLSPSKACLSTAGCNFDNGGDSRFHAARRLPLELRHSSTPAG